MCLSDRSPFSFLNKGVMFSSENSLLHSFQNKFYIVWYLLLLKTELSNSYVA